MILVDRVLPHFNPYAFLKRFAESVIPQSRVEGNATFQLLLPKDLNEHDTRQMITAEKSVQRLYHAPRKQWIDSRHKIGMPSNLIRIVRIRFYGPRPIKTKMVKVLFNLT